MNDSVPYDMAAGLGNLIGAKQYAQNQQTGKGNYPMQPSSPAASVANQVDMALQVSSQVCALAMDLLYVVRGQSSPTSNETQPMRSGLDGRIMDTRERCEYALKSLQELRDYLIGG